MNALHTPGTAEKPSRAWRWARRRDASDETYQLDRRGSEQAATPPSAGAAGLSAVPEHFPHWLRAWHWLNALLFVILAITGFSLHFAAGVIPFNAARVTHNLCGVALTVNYLFFLVMNAASGNGVHYLPQPKGLLQRLWIQSMFYAVGIFRGEHHPFPPQPRAKYNPLQQLTYLGVMYGALPVLIGSGLLYFFPELLPERILGWGGVWPVAVLHTLMGFLLVAFLIAHIYLATVGETLTSDLKKMIFGDKKQAGHSAH